MVKLARQTVAEVHRDVQDLAAGRREDEPGMQPSLLLPWPALFGSCLLWWPEAEYQRIVRQVPDIRSVLGATWREHTVLVRLDCPLRTLLPTSQLTAARRGGDGSAPPTPGYRETLLVLQWLRHHRLHESRKRLMQSSDTCGLETSD